jgi:DNA-binding response OmpR family regulator
MRDLLRVVLEREGYAVDVAADGEEGLRLQSDRPADVVITDIFMPNRDGLETVGQLRAQHPRVKVLVISGGGDVVRGTTYLSTAREIGAHAVLRKPFDLPALLDTVRGLFRETNA